MPTGSFWGDNIGGGGWGGRSSGSSMTGTGAPSNPRAASWLDTTPGGTGMTAASPRYAGGSGFSEPMQTPSSGIGANQFPMGQGPSATMPGSIAQYPTSLYPSTNPYASNLAGAQALASTLFGPQQTLLDQQLARQQSQLGMIGMDADYKTDALNRDNALAKQLLGLDRQGLGIDAGLTKTQLGNLDRLRGILKKQYGLQGENLANQLAGFQVSEDKARDMAKRETFDLRSALTARGAYNTVANDRGTGRINRDLQYQLRDINVGRTGADIGYRGNVLGLDEKGIGYDNQAAGLNARLANIGLDTQRLGISEQQLANSLQDGLHQIGMDSMVSINGLLDAIGGTNAQQSQLAATILTEVMGYANLPPEVLASITAALGVGATGGSAQTPRSPLTPEMRGVA